MNIKQLRLFAILLGLVLTASAAAQEKPKTAAKPAKAAPHWDLDALSKTPKTYAASEPTAKDVTSIFYDGLPYHKKPTRVFAYYGIPKTAPGEKVAGTFFTLFTQKIHMGAGALRYDGWPKEPGTVSSSLQMGKIGLYFFFVGSTGR